MTRPPLSLSLQFADASHRALLPRHRVARWLSAALQHPAELTVRIVEAYETADALGDSGASGSAQRRGRRGAG